MKEKLANLKDFFKTGNTLNYEFRIKQLENLKAGLQAREEDILTSLKLDMGKPSFEAYSSEISLLYEQIDLALSSLSTWMKDERVSTPLHLQPAKSYIRPSPKGLVLIVSPWNYPFLLSFSPLIGAIAAGNTALVKPSSRADLSSRLIVKIIQESFEDDYVHALMGKGSELVPQLLQEGDFNHVFFTGSKEVGSSLAGLCAEKLIPFSLELGGKSPAIVDETTDLALAAKKIIWAKLFNAGQTCIAPDYLIINKNIKDEFVNLMIKSIIEFYGPKQEESKDFARIIDLEALRRLKGLVDNNKILFGGQVLEEELYFQPSILDASLEDAIMQEEIFGPILPIICYEDELEIIEIIEKNRNPLSLYLFSEDQVLQNIILDALSFGGACLNDSLSQILNINLPFGGVGESGVGSSQGYYSFREFSNFKSIMEAKTSLDLKVKYPPYTKAKMAMSKLFLK